MDKEKPKVILQLDNSLRKGYSNKEESNVMDIGLTVAVNV